MLATISPGNILANSALFLFALALAGLLIQRVLLSLLPGTRKKLAAFTAFAGEQGGTSGRTGLDGEPWLEVVRERWTLRAEMHIRRRRTFLQVVLRGLETGLDHRVTVLAASEPTTPVERALHDAALRLGTIAERGDAARAARDTLYETWADRGEVGTQLRGWRAAKTFGAELLEVERVLGDLAEAVRRG
ncbi:MAG: hypothetical protein H6828_15985 [Planctomycetes bacterium]|nr:hypothetical protein [Planctomycetota bacterium]MCB9916626.1 hypothetical protein [Planctomycetota bacterium]